MQRYLLRRSLANARVKLTWMTVGTVTYLCSSQGSDEEKQRRSRILNSECLKPSSLVGSYCLHLISLGESFYRFQLVMGSMPWLRMVGNVTLRLRSTWGTGPPKELQRHCRSHMETVCLETEPLGRVLL